MQRFLCCTVDSAGRPARGGHRPACAAEAYPGSACGARFVYFNSYCHFVRASSPRRQVFRNGTATDGALRGVLDRFAAEHEALPHVVVTDTQRVAELAEERGMLTTRKLGRPVHLGQTRTCPMCLRTTSQPSMPTGSSYAALRTPTGSANRRSCSRRVSRPETRKTSPLFLRALSVSDVA